MARKFKPSIALTKDQKRKALSLLHKKWKPHENQKKILREVYANGCKRIFIRAGRKFGKNELGNYFGWRTSIVKDKGESYIIGSTAEDEKKIIWENERLQDFGPNFDQTADNNQYILKFPWGSFVQIDGCRNVAAGRGRTFDLVLYDEGKDQKRDYYDAAYPNLLAKDGLLIFMGTPPDVDDPDGEFYRDVEEEAKVSKHWEHFRFTSWDNPHLSRQWLEEEKSAYYRRGEELIWAREYEAEDVQGTVGVIFPMFQYAFHCRPIEVLMAELKKGVNSGSVDFYCLIDPGQDVCAVLFIAYNRESSQIYVLDEIYEQDRYKTSAVPIWDNSCIKKKEMFPDLDLEFWEDVYDEAASQFEVEIMNQFGAKIRPTQKKSGRGTLMHVSLLKDAMTVPRGFQVATQCVNTIKEIQQLKDANARDKNHTIDLLRYFTDECNYQYQNTKERLIVDKRLLTSRPRGASLAQDMLKWDQQADPFGHLMDGSFDITDYGDIFGMN